MSYKELIDILPVEIVNNILLPYLVKTKIEYMRDYREVLREMHCLFFYLDFGDLQHKCDFFLECSNFDFLLKVIKEGDYDKNAKENEPIYFKGFKPIYDFRLNRFDLIDIKINIRTRDFEKYSIDMSECNRKRAKKFYLRTRGRPQFYDKNTHRLKSGVRLYLKENYKFTVFNQQFIDVNIEDIPQKRNKINFKDWYEIEPFYYKKHPRIKNKMIRCTHPKKIEFFNFETKKYDLEAYKKALDERL